MTMGWGRADMALAWGTSLPALLRLVRLLNIVSARRSGELAGRGGSRGRSNEGRPEELYSSVY